MKIMDPIVSSPYASYYLCDYCPYMCLAEALLTEHVKLVHKIKKPSQVYELQCPACPNIFFHKISLQSHLAHDHCLKLEDLGKMMQIVLHTKKSTSYTKRDPCHIEKIATIEKIEQIEVTESSIQVSDSNPEKTILIFNENATRQSTDSPEVKLFGLTNQVNTLTDIRIVNDPVTNEISFIEPNEAHDAKNSKEEMLSNNSLDDAIEADTTDATDDNNEENNLKSELTPNVNIDMNNASIANQSMQETVVLDNVLPLKYEIPKRMYKCTVDKCRHQMENASKMEYHVKCHSEGKFICPECKKSFSNWNTMAGHLWRAHQVDMELVKCDLCDYRTYSFRKLYNQHRLIHGEDKSYKCDKCDKSFKNSKQMRNHKDATHKEKDVMGVSPQTQFSCETCKKVFAKRRLLKKHCDTVHKKLKPHVCKFCGFNTTTKGALNMHVRLHTGEEPYQCNFCEYSTADHNSLRRHKLRHTGEKPYKCPHCNYECIQSSTFKMHIKMKHPGLDKNIIFSCSLCQFRSVNKTVYNAHMHTHHQDMSETKPSTSTGDKFELVVADGILLVEEILEK